MYTKQLMRQDLHKRQAWHRPGTQEVQQRFFRALVAESKKAGNYQVIWNGLDNAGSQVSSGVYFCTMKTADYFTTRKLMLLR